MREKRQCHALYKQTHVSAMRPVNLEFIIRPRWPKDLDTSRKSCFTGVRGNTA
jgi:hypothetical protein